MKFKKRELLYNQDNKFNWSNEVLISRIEDANCLTFYTKEKHNLITGNIIALLGGDHVDSNLIWLLNNDVNSISCGNNLLFKVRLCIPAHDEWNIEVPENIADDMAKVLADCMSRAGEYFCKLIKFPADAEIGNCWIH